MSYTYLELPVALGYLDSLVVHQYLLVLNFLVCL